MKEVKRLIEVAMPVKEISAESVRDKSIRHGHISTLHLWWARRPLPVCRAVIFASLVPDPLEKNCPESFKKAVKILLSGSKKFGDANLGDPYKPYDDIPFTAAEDPMEDNLRNRLLMFIGKFSDTFLTNEKKGKTTNAKDQLSNFSLIKWDNKNNENIINIARKLIWVAHNAENGDNRTADELIDDFEKYYKEIKNAEKELYNTPDRHLDTVENKKKEAALQKAIDAFLEKMPKVFDPFAGGGAIPLEAARLGCRSYANDLNPVAHIIEKGSCEFPQKYGKPITYSKDEFVKIYGKDEFERVRDEHKVKNIDGKEYVDIENRLSFDVEYYAKKMLKMAEDEIGHLYAPDKDGNKPVAYYWARVATCSNPSCKAEVPLLRQFYLVNKPEKKIFIQPIINKNKITFEIKNGMCNEEGWMQRANLKCPCCGNITEVKAIKNQFNNRLIKEKLLAVIFESDQTKEYKLPDFGDLNKTLDIERIDDIYKEKMPENDSQNIKIPLWGFQYWTDMYTNRQILAMKTFVEKLSTIKSTLDFEDNTKHEYYKAVVTYLAILINRLSSRNTSFGLWDTTRETLVQPFGRQAIPMVFDYPESNPFCSSSGSAFNQIEWIIRYIENESNYIFSSICNNSSSGDITQFNNKSLASVVTDPPYYDAISYADLSDFFYVWIKKTLDDIYPNNVRYPLTPKDDECTAIKHRHDGNIKKAKQHFENKLQQIFSAIEKQTSGIVSIMFAHQSTEAWSTLCNSILNANMNITGSWSTDTELTHALKSNKAFLTSSVTVSCRPSNKSGYGDYKEIKKAIDKKIKEEVKILYDLGFRGADLLTSCFGQAVSEFGKYEKVEKADGTEVSVADLLETARESAFNAIVSDIDTDDFTRFYIGWLNLFGFSEAEHDDVRRITQIGLNIDTAELNSKNILLKNGNRESLAGFSDRINKNKALGDTAEDIDIDKAHKAMHLFSGSKRENLLFYLARHGYSNESSLWRVLNSLMEIIPPGTEDHKQISGLIANKESLIRDAKAIKEGELEQRELF